MQKLRELILELAVRGKLVPQDPNDEPASVLLERIAVEKARLVQEKKIKKQKALPPISDDEKPFDLPSGWNWANAIELCSQITDGEHSTPKRINNPHEIPLVTAKNVRDGYMDYGITDFVPREVSEKCWARCKPEENDILMVSVGATLGRLSVLSHSKEMVLVRSVTLLKPVEIESEYLALAIRSPVVQKWIWNNVRQSAQPCLYLSKSCSLPIPVPPSNERSRIVTKVNELMTLCDQLEQQTESSITAHATLVETLLNTLTASTCAEELQQNWNRIDEHFDTLFTTEESIDQLKQTILQLAVMGRLVPQNPSDEPASVLLERIAAEKAQLVKDKKIKKQKPLPPIGEDEKPFDLPVGWAFARFEDVVEIHSGITKGRKLAGRELISVPYLRVANVQRGALNLDEIKEVEIPVEEKDKYEVLSGDLLITEGGDWDKVGRTTRWSGETPYMAHQNHVFKARKYLPEQNEQWLEMYLNGPVAREYFAGSSKQTTNLASINKTQLRGCLIAIPPVNERSKIVERMYQLTQLCDQLVDKLQQARQNRIHMTNAMVEQALA